MNQLVALENLTPLEIYSPEKVDSILGKISDEAKSFKPDLSTVFGRKEIASLAYKIAQSKTFMDDCGKKLGEDAKKTLDTINSERKKIRETLDALKEEVRKPLTDWEVKEEQRKTKHRNDLLQIEKVSQKIAAEWLTTSTTEIEDALAAVKLAYAFDWEDFKEDASTIIPIAEAKLNASLESKKLHDEQQAELQKLRAEKEQRGKEEAERLEIERNQAWIKSQQEEKARQINQQKKEEAEREQKRVAREKQLEEEKQAAIKYERDQIEIKLKQAEEKSVRDKHLAIEAERKKVADDKKAVELEEQKRQSNLKHRTKINNEILKSLTNQGLDVETAKKVIMAIVTGLIPHAKITY